MKLKENAPFKKIKTNVVKVGREFQEILKI